MKKKINLFITDDKIEYRNIIKQILESHPVKIIGEATNGQILIEALEQGINPDVIILDIEMDVMDGCKAFEIIREKFPKQKVIMISMHYQEILIENFVERGVKGYISKDAICDKPNLLYKALCRVNSGGVYVHEKSKDSLILSRRQKQILPKVFNNKTNEEIAKELDISKRAVEKQRIKIYEKAGTKNSLDFYKYAFSRGLQYLVDTFGKNTKSSKK